MRRKKAKKRVTTPPVITVEQPEEYKNVIKEKQDPYTKSIKYFDIRY